MKKNILLAFCFISLAYSATGCSSANGSGGFTEKLENAVMQRSGIITDTNYINYRLDLAAGKIRDDYYYDETMPVEISGGDRQFSSDKVCISISDNSLLDIRYFYDANQEFEITSPTQNYIFLEPGEQIYASASTGSSISGSDYEISEFRIYDISSGSRKLVSSGYDKTTGLVYTAPEDCGGMQIAIVPAGKYTTNDVSVSCYCTDDTFKQTEAEGKWTVNGEEFTDSHFSVSSSESYYVGFEFDSEKYFFVSSDPKCLYQDEGRVLFSRAYADDDISEYSVELHPFISTVITADSNAKAEINGISAGSFQKGQDIELNGLRFGDTVVITCSKKETLKYDKNVLSLTKSEDSFGVYTFTVKEPSDDFTFNPDDYSFEHGEIEFSYLGNKITGKISLSAGRQIGYSAVSADDGWWLPDGDNFITVSDDPAETRKAIEKIRFYEKKLVSVSFPQPVSGGTITYKKGERTILNKSEKIFSGTEIKMKFNPWTGWDTDVTEASFIVSDSSETQTASPEGIDINSIFREIDEHKPHLTVSADKLVPGSMKFTVKTSDVSESDLSRDWKQTTLLECETGTAEGITLAASGKLQKDEVLKLTVVKTNQNGGKNTEILYMSELPSEKTLDIYSDTEMKTSEMYYTDISINITVAEKKIYDPVIFENAKLSLRFADTDSRNILSAGDITDDARIVSVTLSPSGSYYISGENLTGDVYQAKMKYSEFLANTEKINKSYPRKKICRIELDTSDEYGKVSYTLNGKDVTGSVEVREEDELIINYSLENKDYIIYKDFLSAMHDLLSNSPYEKSETISIIPELDGTVIRREDYITVQKKEK